METPTIWTKCRPKISLLSLLLVMATVALALTIVRLSGENGVLRDELAKYRAELGVLDDSASECFNVIRIEAEETPVSREWKWRLKAPADSNAYITVSESPVSLPGGGIPPPSVSIPLVPEMEHVFSISAIHDEKTGLWNAELGWRREDGRVHKRVWSKTFDWKADTAVGVIEGVNFRTKQLPVD